MVSGSLSSPFRGAFHLSLTVLVHYRSLKVFSLGGWSPLLPTNSPGFVVLRIQLASPRLSLRGSHPLRRRVPTPSGRFRLACVLLLQPHPLPCRRGWFGLIPSRSPLLRDSRLISLRRATEMFQFAHGPPACLCIQQAVSRHHSGRVAPLGYFGLSARIQLPRNVSPVSASFFGLQRQGIHLVLCVACSQFGVCFDSYTYLRVLSSVSTRAKVYASAKLKIYPIQLVRCRVWYNPNPWRVETSLVLVNRLLVALRPVISPIR